MRTTTIAAITCAVLATACANDNPPKDASSVGVSPPVATASPAESRTGVAETMTPGTRMGDSSRTDTTGAAPSAPSSGAPSSTVMSPAPAPSSTTGAGAPPANHDPNADNTGKNTRDRGATLTPMSQGNSSAEVKITAAIRRSLMGDHSLSFTAKNVKIITNGTTVTLRGPVKSDAERSAIESAARAADGVTDVDNQLEVKK